MLLETLRKSLFRSLPLALPLLSLSACSKDSTKDAETESVVFAGRVWSNPEAIPLCLTNPDEVDQGLVNDLKEFSSKDYSSKAGIQFVGWEPCTQNDYRREVIRLRFNRIHDWNNRFSFNAGGGISMVGPAVQSCPNCQGATMQIDIGTQGRYPEPNHPGRGFILTQTRATMVHELGHAVGLLHEHERSDGPGCRDFPQELYNQRGGTVFVGRYDPDSIMNYCHDQNLSTLSSGDVAGLKHLYPSAGGNPAESPEPTLRPRPVPKLNPRPENPRPAPIKSPEPKGPDFPKPTTPDFPPFQQPELEPELESPCEPKVAPASRIGRTEDTGFLRLVVFRNSCSQPLTVYWMNGEGVPVSYGSIAPRQMLLVKTYQEHAWQFRNANSGKLIKEFRIAPWMLLVQVP